MRVAMALFASLAVLVPPVALVAAEPNELPEKGVEILTAGPWQLLSLEPTKPSQPIAEEESFHGYQILGATEIKGRRAQRLLTALVEGMKGEITPARCFRPRHGIQATHEGQTVEVLICFECFQVHVYLPGAKAPQRLPIGRGPEEAFDAEFAEVGIPKAK